MIAEVALYWNFDLWIGFMIYDVCFGDFIFVFVHKEIFFINIVAYLLLQGCYLCIYLHSWTDTEQCSILCCKTYCHTWHGLINLFHRSRVRLTYVTELVLVALLLSIQTLYLGRISCESQLKKWYIYFDKWFIFLDK